MDLAQLETFVCIAQERSFSRAAERLCRTQPALSISMKRLEEELDVVLFDRSSKGGVLTEAGSVLLSYARRMLALRTEAFDALGELRGKIRGRLSIGANESTAVYLLPPMLLAFRQRFPQLRIHVSRHPSDQIPQLVLERELDLGFLSFDPRHPDLRSLQVQRDELVLVVPPEHRLAGRSVRIRELADETFLAHNVRTPSRDKVMALFAEHRVPLNIGMELATLQTIREFVKRGAGIAILPRLSLQADLAEGSLVEVPIAELKVEKVLRLVHRAEAGLSHAAQAFLELVKESVGEAP